MTEKKGFLQVKRVLTNKPCLGNCGNDKENLVTMDPRRPDLDLLFGRNKTTKTLN